MKKKAKKKSKPRTKKAKPKAAKKFVETDPSRLAHDAFEALGSIRSRLTLPKHRKELMRFTKHTLILCMESLREIADMGMNLEPDEQSGSSAIYRIDLSPLKPSPPVGFEDREAEADRALWMRRTK
jgi:hypothetical protein